ncbi:MAG: Spx/MgsR family RNA polymerase-binding regulatory protein [Tissierellia bacterium]|nr:Spx/MgsR family RNA polymerase-binding regulatory protein [Tissierellia bacterium]
MLVICYKKCGTCRKLEKTLNEKNISYDYRHIDQDNPSVEELKDWHEKTGLDIKRFFNTSGKIYREEKLKDKLPSMSLEEKYDLLARDGLLVKRPIILDQDEVYIGPDAVKYVDGM